MELNDFIKQLADSDRILTEKSKAIMAYDKRVKDLTAQVSSAEKLLADYDVAIKQKTEQIKSLDNEIAQKHTVSSNAQAVDRSESLKTLDEVRAIKQQAEQLNAQNDKARQDIDTRVKELSAKIAHLEQEKDTLTKKTHEVNTLFSAANSRHHEANALFAQLKRDREDIEKDRVVLKQREASVDVRVKDADTLLSSVKNNKDEHIQQMRLANKLIDEYSVKSYKYDKAVEEAYSMRNQAQVALDKALERERIADSIVKDVNEKMEHAKYLEIRLRKILNKYNLQKELESL
jgi:chromosome segregation ATPase